MRTQIDSLKLQSSEGSAEQENPENLRTLEAN